MSQALNNLKKLIIETIEEENSIEEKLNLFFEKNVPTNPSKWSYYKSQAKKKFDVYPSAYANAWAAKMYKGAGGGWKKEQIGEASMTGNLDGGEGPPKTPYAFQSKKKRKQDKDKEDSIATTSTGFKKVNEAVDEGDFISAIQSIQAGLDEAEYGFNDLVRLRGMSSSEKRIVKTLFSRFKVLMKGVEKARRVIKNESINEGRYHDWRNDESLTPKQKIGRSIREVKNSLNELDKTIKMNQRLKNELKVDSKDYWKTTHKALSSISERLVRLASRVGNLR